MSEPHILGVFDPFKRTSVCIKCGIEISLAAIALGVLPFPCPGQMAVDEKNKPKSTQISTDDDDDLDDLIRLPNNLYQQMKAKAKEMEQPYALAFRITLAMYERVYKLQHKGYRLHERPDLIEDFDDLIARMEALEQKP
jgi:hypothetical protein